MAPTANSIRFLGTAGGRWVVAKQIRASGGIYLQLEGKRILMDPGPGSLVRCAQTEPPIEVAELDAVLLTHAHIDHCNDVNIIIDAMTAGGIFRRGTLFAPRQCIEGDNAVVYNYVRRFLHDIVPIEPSGTYALGNLHFKTSIPHDHGVDTFGVKFHLSGSTLGFLLDTRYFPELPAAYNEVDVLVVYATFVDRPHKSQIKHLCVQDVRDIAHGARPKKIILTHFGREFLEEGPEKIAAKLTDELGIEVIAAEDGMVVDL